MAEDLPIQVPSDEELVGILARRGCLSLRALCQELRPELRWRPLYPGEQSISEWCGPDGLTWALRIWLRLGSLVWADRVRVVGLDPDEVDPFAGVTFEIVGLRRAARSNPMA